MPLDVASARVHLNGKAGQPTSDRLAVAAGLVDAYLHRLFVSPNARRPRAVQHTEIGWIYLDRCDRAQLLDQHDRVVRSLAARAAAQTESSRGRTSRTRGERQLAVPFGGDADGSAST